MKAHVKRCLALIPGWRTKRKLLVIQSDDWFGIRTSSLAALRHLESLGVDVHQCHYMALDHLETGAELSGLFETLSSVRDCNGRPACLTANCLSGNPDFSRIAQSGFAEYHYEPSVITAARIQGAEGNLQFWREAVSAGVCEPQSHGREHLNIPRWLHALRSGTDNITRAAFDHEMFGVSGHVVPQPRESFMAAFDTSDNPVSPDPLPIISNALEGFKQMFGFVSRSFIAPNYVWGEEVETALNHHNVEYIQSGRLQWIPNHDGQARMARRRFLGKGNSFGQIYLVRNVDFEPASDPNVDWQDRALSQVKLAFMLRKPAVISTHRVNYMGGLCPANRNRGLKELKGLLQRIVKRWPTVEFISTTELGDMIKADRKT